MKRRPTQPSSEPPDLDVFDWNFDGVPDGELIACCYWEYARESELIRRTLHDYREWYQAGGRWSDAPPGLDRNLERVQSIGYAAEVFLRGCAFEPDAVRQSLDPAKADYQHPDAPVLSGSFPAPWQRLRPEERKERSHIRTNRTTLPLVPFERADWSVAGDIARWTEGRWRTLHAEYKTVRSENPVASEVDLIKQGKLKPYPGIQPSLYWEGGGEVTVVSIQWSDFTNEELVQYFRKWVKANRPKNLKNPDARGHKLKDWRANLTRLAVMRLLSHLPALDLVDSRLNKLPDI